MQFIKVASQRIKKAVGDRSVRWQSTMWSSRSRKVFDPGRSGFRSPANNSIVVVLRQIIARISLVHEIWRQYFVGFVFWFANGISLVAIHKYAILLVERYHVIDLWFLTEKIRFFDFLKNNSHLRWFQGKSRGTQTKTSQYVNSFHQVTYLLDVSCLTYLTWEIRHDASACLRQWYMNRTCRYAYVLI